MLPVGWSIAKFLVRVVLPSVPEVVSAVRNVKKKQAHGEAEHANSEARVAELEKNVKAQLHLIEQLTTQLEGLRRSVAIALWLAVGGLIAALVILGLLIFT